MTKKELAALLGISGAMVTKLAKRGMPTNSLERAERWRKRHLEPGRVKGTRFDSNYRPMSQGPSVRNAPLGHYRSIAAELLDTASLALSAGVNIDALAPGLRAAMAAVPVQERDQMRLPVNVMDVLTADVRALLESMSDDPPIDGDQPTRCDSDSMSDEEAETMGDFWYRVAAGEIRPTA